MGSLQRFDLLKYAAEYRLSYFFETGTFRGDGVQLALDAGFEKVYSVEIVDEFHVASVKRFARDERVTLLHSTSVEALDRVLPSIDGNILFWLDAHFPGADDGLRDYNSEPNEAVRCPLEFELETIKKHRARFSDLMLIDDLRVYQIGDYENGNLPDFIRRPDGGIDFVDRIFGDTHHRIDLPDDEGYLLLLPRDRVPKIYLHRNRFLDPDSDIARLLTGRTRQTR